MKFIMTNYIRIIPMFFLLIFHMELKCQIEKEIEYYEDSSSYDVSFYWLNLNVSDNSINLSGNTSIAARATKTDLSRFYIELSDSLTIDSMIVENVKQTYVHNNGWIKCNLSNSILKDKIFTTKIFYHGFGSKNGSFGGLKVDTILSSPVLSVLAEPFNSLVFFPCKQYLTDKADSAFIYLTVPEGQVAASNGVLKETTILPGNKILYKWETRYPIAYYLIAFAVSDYNEYSYRFYDNNYSDSIFFQNFIYPGPAYLNSVKNNIDKTVDIIKFYEQLTNVAFPFRKEKYGHVTAPIGGGMENQTLTMLSNFDIELVAHELGHSWFGDLVTCSDWQNIWINEGFATYMEFLKIEHFDSTSTINWLKGALYAALREPEGSVYVPDNSRWSDNRIFNSRLSYNKGALVLHTLRRKINNDQVFFEIFNTFLNKYAYKNASAEDFKNVAELVSGLNLDDFFRQWYYGSGYPVISAVWQSNLDSLSLTIHYKGSSVTNPIFNFNLDVLAHLKKAKDTLLQVAINDTVQTNRFKLSSVIDSIELNPYINLIADITLTHTIREIHSFEVYPNPFKDSTAVYFKKNSFNRTVELYNIKGIKIGIWNNVSSAFDINFRSLAPGIYLLRAQDNYGTYTRKIVKK